MKGYVTLGTNDVGRAGRFYDRLLAPLGAARSKDSDKLIMWSNGEGEILGVIVPIDGLPATFGNGCMVALNLENPAEVDTIHALALGLGATNEGDPGRRGESGTFYGAYFRDLDGHKIVVYHRSSHG